MKLAPWSYPAVGAVVGKVLAGASNNSPLMDVVYEISGARAVVTHCCPQGLHFHGAAIRSSHARAAAVVSTAAGEKGPQSARSQAGPRRRALSSCCGPQRPRRRTHLNGSLGAKGSLEIGLDSERPLQRVLYL